MLLTLRRETSSVPDIRSHALDWHAAILRSVAASDQQDAREAMRAHLVQTEEDLGSDAVAEAALG